MRERRRVEVELRRLSRLDGRGCLPRKPDAAVDHVHPPRSTSGKSTCTRRRPTSRGNRPRAGSGRHFTATPLDGWWGGFPPRAPAARLGWPVMSEDWFDELAEFLRIPSISADAGHAAEVVRAAEWVRDFVRGSGGEACVVDWNGQPLAIGEIRASGGGDAAPTVLCYGHFDVQPPDPLELWESARRSSPRSATGTSTPAAPPTTRGSSTCCSRPRASWRRPASCPSTCASACDGEEETGGHSIVEFLAADERGADAAVIFDSEMIEPRPARVQRRHARDGYFHVTVRTGERDLHSGVYGGAALNAAHALVQALSGGPRRATVGCRAAADGDRAADRAGARGLARAADRRARARRAGRAADGRARRRGVLRAHVRRAGARRERHRERARRSLQKTVLPVEAVGEPLDPARARPARRGDRARGRAAAPRGGAGRAPSSSSSSGRRRRPGSSRPTRARSSSGSTRSSASSAAGPR